MNKPQKPARAELERRLREVEAQMAHVYHFADASLHNAGAGYLTASGLLLTMHALGGSEVVPPVVIRGGLSDETIAALRKDIERSYREAIEFKPKGIA